MGAVIFSLDVNLAKVLKDDLGFGVFVETGTFRGETVEVLKDKFNRIYTIELSSEYYAEACAKFAGLDHVHVLQGDSAQVLKTVVADLKDVSTLYFLDAHWCVAESTAGKKSQCPLLAELESIGTLNETSVIIIDDARLFLAPPLAPHEISQWPTLNEILNQLDAMSSSHEVMVLNDNILFFPAATKAAISEYASKNGVDWLETVHKTDDYDNLRQQFEGLLEQLKEKDEQLKEKDEQLKEKDEQLKEKDEQLKEKDEQLKEKDEQLNQIKATFFRRLLQSKNLHWVWRLIGLTRPKLGHLYQYPPRHLQLPKSCGERKNLTSWPKISIVTPSYGQGKFIERTIRSVLDQEYLNLEYFVQDGESNDDTVNILKRYEQKLSGWKSEPDSGQSQAINWGMVQSTGEVMAWLNSDDLLLPGSLACVADYFDKHPEVDVVYGHRILINENDQEIGRWVMPGHDDEVLSWADYIPQETLFWRRSIWEKAGGGIDESFDFAMDWDLILRFRDVGARFKRLPRFLGALRVHSEQKTSALIQDIGAQEMARLRQRCLGRAVNQDEIYRALSPYLRKHIVEHLKYRIQSRMTLT